MWRKTERVLTKLIQWGVVVALASFCLHDFVPEAWRSAMVIFCSVSCYVVLLSWCARIVVQRIAWGCEHPRGSRGDECDADFDPPAESVSARIEPKNRCV